MNAGDFARKLIHGPGGMNDFESREVVVFHNDDRVAAAIWTLRCLANPDCEGSEIAVAAILQQREKKRKEKS